jgi:uncharacterized protein (DUF305 family)
MSGDVMTEERPDALADESTGNEGTPGEETPQPARGRFPTAWVALGIVVGLILGYVAGLLTPSLRTPGDTSAEAGFARDMALHHAQAVEMAMIAYQRSTDPDVQLMAYDIATSQQTEIGIMKRWLEEWGLSRSGSQPRMAWMPGGEHALRDGLMPGMATNEEIDRLRNATGREVDVLFAQLMLRHHLGGIHMIDAVLAQSDRPEVVSLAERMKSTQQEEVQVFRAMLKELGAEPL